eukprot:TRINITY_DN6046_c1_g1_i1.p1 TRINITY_DN6046_c1_g1~~TRINITY_DN6046_c1_g1_i1.p1  ORF type:complete len:354 (+),score=48.76 TRINITY_DN6046_c1_g1_i1:296-1357(+)
MDIFIKAGDQTLPYTLHTDDVASTVLSWVEGETGLHADLLHVEHEGAIVANKSPLAGLAICGGDTLHVAVNKDRLVPFVNEGMVRVQLDSLDPQTDAVALPIRLQYTAERAASSAVQHFLEGGNSAVIIAGCDNTHGTRCFREILEQVCEKTGPGKEVMIVTVRGYKLVDMVKWGLGSGENDVKIIEDPARRVTLRGCSVHNSEDVLDVYSHCAKELYIHTISMSHRPGGETKIAIFTDRNCDPPAVLTLAQMRWDHAEVANQQRVLRSIITSYPRKRHHPYRDSRFTRLLQNNLSDPTSYTALVGAVSASPDRIEQTADVIEMLRDATQCGKASTTTDEGERGGLGKRAGCV